MKKRDTKGKNRKKHNHERIGEVIDIGVVLHHITEDDGKRVTFNGIKVRVCSKRLQIFKLKGVDCVTCGAVGAYFAVERDKAGGSCHLNLYAIDNQGDEVLMTKDHIKPKSKGGPDDLSNLQPMCKVCNEKKSNN